MSGTDGQVVAIAELFPDGGHRAPVRAHFGIEAFGVNAWRPPADGGDVIGAHDERGDGHQELFVVLDGSATFQLDGETVEAGPGTLVAVLDPAVRRGATGRATVLAIGAAPGKVYEVSPWERNADVFALFGEGRIEEARRRLRALVEAEPEAAGPRYNLACAESLLGEREAALEHLLRAVELSPGFADHAQEDPDFDAIRDDPRFPAPAGDPAEEQEAAARSGGWATARVEELEALPVDDEGLTWRPVRRHFGIEAFGVNAYTAASAGDRVVEEHAEPDGHDELYVVLAGRARFRLGDREVDAPAGTAVHAAPSVRRGAVAEEAGTTVLAVGAKRGEVFAPSKWEVAFAAHGYRRLGEPERGRALLAAALAEAPDDWAAHYTTAAFEALEGNRDAALEHLARAVELGPESAREWVAADRDLDGLRDDPRFPAP